jgi:hypothetical protein
MPAVFKRDAFASWGALEPWAPTPRVWPQAAFTDTPFVINKWGVATG